LISIFSTKSHYSIVRGQSCTTKTATRRDLLAPRR